MTGALAPPALPRGTVPGPSAGGPGGTLGNLFPEVTPAPAAPGAGRAHPGPPGAGGTGAALTAETGMTGHAPSAVIMLGVTIAAGLAAFGAWLAMAGPGRRAVLSLARRRGRHTR